MLVMDHGKMALKDGPDGRSSERKRVRRTVDLYDDEVKAKKIRGPSSVVGGQVTIKTPSRAPERALSKSIAYRNVSVVSPTVLQRAMPHLETMGLLGLVRQPWNITSRFASQEFIDFESRRDAFPSDHRLYKVTFDRELFSRLYHLPTTGYLIGQDWLRTDPEYLAKYFRGISAPFGWYIDAIIDPQLSAVFQVLNPILNLERPGQITKPVAMVVCKAWEVKDLNEKPDWSAFVSETFWRLKGKKKQFFSPYLLHAYRDMDLLSPEEKQGFENLQNGVVGSSGAQSQPHSIRYTKVAAPRQGKRTLTDTPGTKTPPMDQNSYAPAPVMDAAGKVKAPLASSEMTSASDFLQSDPTQYNKVMMRFERPISLFATISKMLGCTNDEEVVPQVDALCAAQNKMKRLSTRVQQEKDRTQKAENQNNELRRELASLHNQTGLNQQKEAREQRDALNAEVKVLAREKAKWESTHEAQLIESRKRQEELQAEVDALQGKLTQQEQKVLTFAETFTSRSR